MNPRRDDDYFINIRGVYYRNLSVFCDLADTSWESATLTESIIVPSMAVKGCIAAFSCRSEMFRHSRIFSVDDINGTLRFNHHLN